jgi:hypothetical protein
LFYSFCIDKEIPQKSKVLIKKELKIFAKIKNKKQKGEKNGKECKRDNVSVG